MLPRIFLLICLLASGWAVAADLDFDSYPDDWELANGMDPAVSDLTLAVSSGYACALHRGEVVCWGDNAAVNAVPSLSNPTKIVSGYGYACALDDTGVVCWGDSPYVLPVPALQNVSMLEGGARNVCVLSNNDVMCWGQRPEINTAPNFSNTPAALSVGQDHACAMFDDGVICWGGRQDHAYFEDITEEPPVSSPVQISSGDHHVCALSSQGVVSCWGWNSYSQAVAPVLQNPTRMISDGDRSCAFEDRGLICWWDEGVVYDGSGGVPNLVNLDKEASYNCYLGDQGVSCTSYSDNEAFTTIPLILHDHDVDKISSSYEQQYSSVLDYLDPSDAGNDPDSDNLTNLQEFEAGTNPTIADTDSDGVNDDVEIQLGINPLVNDTDGDGVLDNVDAFPVDPSETVDTDGDGVGDNADEMPNDASELFDWDKDGIGDNADLDDDNDSLSDLDEINIHKTNPYLADTDRDTVNDGLELQRGMDPLYPDFQLQTGYYHACVLQAGTVSCWGENSYGESQVNVPELVNPRWIAAGGNSSCAIDDNGVKCWGEIGLDEMPALVNPRMVGVGSRAACAVDDTGIVCWGNEYNYFTGTIPEVVNPVELQTGVDDLGCVIDEVSPGNREVKCWGSGVSVGIPENLTYPHSLAVLGNDACVMDDQHMHCWSMGEDSISPGPKVSFVTPLALIDSDGLKYWHGTAGQNAAVPELINPVKYTGSCALDDRGVVCWDIPSVADNPPLLPYFQSFPYRDFDGDGISSDYELLYPDVLDRIDPTDAHLDPDGDGLDNLQEYSAKTAPNLADTDGDGLNDYDELNVYKTNPNAIDSDNDGINDSLDAFPLDPAETLDTDGDGVGDNTDPWPADPSEALDTDIDGIGNHADTDDDGDNLSDADELNIYGTDPLLRDTDGDLLSDDFEVQYQHNPLVKNYLGGDGCWDDRGDNSRCNESNQFPGREFQGLKAMESNAYTQCALDDLGVTCWGRSSDPYYSSQLTPPVMENPTELISTVSNYCALHDDGVSCWGNEEDVNNVPALENPTSIASAANDVCAIEDRGVVCWGVNYQGLSSLARFNQPYLVAGNDSYKCVAHLEGISCWGAELGSGVLDAPNLLNVKALIAQSGFACALDTSDEFQCWGRKDGVDKQSFSLGVWPEIDLGTLDSSGFMGKYSWYSFNGSSIVENTIVLVDPDRDGIESRDEVLAGTDPFNHDTDGDGVDDKLDLFPLDTSEQTDFDKDGIGDTADLDDDGDGVADLEDSYPFDSTETVDTDGDGIPDNSDAFVNDPAEHSDSDADGIGDVADTDDDNDGVLDVNDAAPLNPKYSVDTDGDGIVDELDIDPLNPALSNLVRAGGCVLANYEVRCDPQLGANFVTPPNLEMPTQLVGSFGNVCAFDKNGITCWGSDSNQEISIPFSGNARKLVSGYYHSCLLNGGKVKCWGSNEYNSLNVPQITGVVDIFAAGSTSCALTNTSLVCWGGGFPARPDFQLWLQNFSSIEEVQLGGNALCLKDSGLWACWGSYKYEYIGFVRYAPDTLPISDDVISSYQHNLYFSPDFYPSIYDSEVRYSDPEYPFDDFLLDAEQVSVSGNKVCRFKQGLYECVFYEGQQVNDWCDNRYENWDYIGTLYECTHPDTLNNIWYDDAYITELSSDAFSNVLTSRGTCALGTGVGDFNCYEDFIDADGDGLPYYNDPDADGDGIDNVSDAHPYDPGLMGDTDGDQVDEFLDNCPGISNYVQSDSDGDGIGNACDPDVDGDGYNDVDDDFPLNPTLSGDKDGDKVDEVQDNCPGLSNYVQSDSDGDGIGNACDDDIDGDGWSNALDDFDLNPTIAGDKDGDGIDVLVDNCLGLQNPGQSDSDNDGIGNACDDDIDGDGTENLADQFPLNPALSTDLDYDSINDAEDSYTGLQVIDYDVGGHHGCGYTNKGAFCWGYTHAGQGVAPSGLTNITGVAVGRFHSCMISNGAVQCWGDNTNGQLNVPALSNPTAISAGYDHSCAIDDTGVVCWGNDTYGQVSNTPALSNVTQIISAPQYNCAISDVGASCWGMDNDGQVSAMPALSNPVKIAAAYKNVCAIDDTGVVCWGLVQHGRTTPPALNSPSEIAFTSNTACVVDGADVTCWGTSGSNLNQPGKNFRNIKAAINVICGIDDDGLQCWREDSSYGLMQSINSYRHFDIDRDTVSNEFDNCPYVSNFMQSDNDNDGLGNACDPDVDGDGYNDGLDQYPLNPSLVGDFDGDKVDELLDNCPGLANYGQSDSDGDGLGNACDPDVDGDGYDDVVDQYPLNPTLAGDLDADQVDEFIDNCPGVSNFQQNDLDADGRGDACDDDIDGDGVNNSSDTHPLNPSLMTADDDSDGLDNSLDNCPAVANGGQSDSDLDGMGDACDEDIDGDGSVNVLDQYPLNPTLAMDLDKDGIDDAVDPDKAFDVIDYAIGGHHGCGYNENGLFCWGYNNKGQAQVPPGLNGEVTAVTAGQFHSCAIVDGLVDCWGDNSFGQSNVPALVNPVALSAGYNHTCAQDDTGMVCWGSNAYSLVSNTPVLSNVSQIMSAPKFNCAISDSGASCWGMDTDGQVSGMPVLSNPVKLAGAFKNTCAIDDTGAVCWGLVKDGRTTPPVLTSPSEIAMTSNTACAVDGADVTCWGTTGGGLDQPGKNFRNIKAAINVICGINDDGLECWTNDSFYGAMQLINDYRDYDLDNDGVLNAVDAWPADPAQY